MTQLIFRHAVIARTVITRPLMTKIMFWAVITVLALVAAACGGGAGGMWQGGGDSTPSWR